MCARRPNRSPTNRKSSSIPSVSDVTSLASRSRARSLLIWAARRSRSAGRSDRVRAARHRSHPRTPPSDCTLTAVPGPRGAIVCSSSEDRQSSFDRSTQPGYRRQSRIAPGRPGVRPPVLLLRSRSNVQRTFHPTETQIPGERLHREDALSGAVDCLIPCQFHLFSGLQVHPCSDK